MNFDDYSVVILTLPFKCLNCLYKKEKKKNYTFIQQGSIKLIQLLVY